MALASALAGWLKFDATWGGCYHQCAGWSSLVARWAHNPKVGGSNPPPATNLILLNHNGQRVFRWPFFLFIPCSSVQNFPKIICNSAFVCRDCVRVAHRGLHFGMPEPVQPNRHRGADLIEQRGVPMPKGMKTALRDSKLLQQTDEICASEPDCDPTACLFSLQTAGPRSSDARFFR